MECYELVRVNPDARDVLDLGFCAVRDSYDVLETLVTKILQEQWPRQSPVTALPAIKGFKDLAKDSDELREMIATLTDIVANQIKPQ